MLEPDLRSVIPLQKRNYYTDTSKGWSDEISGENFVLVLRKVTLLKGIYDEYTTGDGYGDGDYAYDGYPGNVLN